MKLSTKDFLIVGAIVVTLLVVFVATRKSDPLGGGLTFQSCITTSSAVVIGNQQSLTILATTTNRAWARVQQPINATNTAFLNFAGAAATVNSSVALTPATTTSPVPFIEFGRNTENPNPGLITGITNSGSTTVLVTECVYP